MRNLKTFETERLYLKPTDQSDGQLILEMMNSPKFIENVGDRKLITVDDAVSYIKLKMISQQEKLGFSNFTLILKENGAKIGTCGLWDRDGLDGIDIGYALLPKYEKQGYAFEAATKIKNIANSEFNYKEIKAITTKFNHESQNLLNKLGFESIGYTNIPGEDAELLLYKFKF